MTNLTLLDLEDNNLTTLPNSIGNLTYLTLLYLWNNQLTTLPDFIGNLTNLTQLYLQFNQLTTLPNSLINLHNCHIYYNDNPIDYISPILHRFLNRSKTVNRYIYHDSQNVHDSNIQTSIRDSILRLSQHKPKYSIQHIKQKILENNILDSEVKS